MRKVLFILLILFFIPLASSNELLEVNNINMTIEQVGNIVASDVNKLTIYFYIYPKEEDYSIISSIKVNPSATLKNDSYVFVWSPANGNIQYSVKSEVSNVVNLRKINSKIKFPFKAPEQYNIYTQSSELCDSDNINIKKLSNSLASGEDDAYKVIFKLTNWVNSNVNYSLDFRNDTLKSSEVLRLKRGACDEFSNLLLAMLRSLNIPARYATGYTYGTYGEHKFESHGWLEAWLPEYGWISVDPTYGELGWLDATHIKLLSSIDPKSSSLEYQWIGGNVESNKLEEKIEVVSSGGKIPIYLEGELKVEDISVDIGSYNILWLNFKNPNDYYISTYAALTSAPNLIGKNGKMVFLEPNGEARVGWIIKYPSNLSESHIWTFFNNATAYFLGNVGSTSIVKSGENSLTLEECEALIQKEEKNIKGSPDISINILKPKEAKIGDTYEITVKVQNKGSGPLENLTICIKEDCREKYIGINQDILESFELVAEYLGENKIIILFKNVNIEPYVLEINVIEKSLLEKIIDFFKKLFKLK